MCIYIIYVCMYVYMYMYIFIYLHIPKWISTGRHDDSPTHVGVPNFRQTHELVPRDTCLVLHFEQQIVSVGGERRSMIQLIEPLADEFGTLRSLVAVTFSYHPCCWGYLGLFFQFSFSSSLCTLEIHLFSI
jgi:hypothetical protein